MKMKLAKVEMEVIRRNVRKMGSNEVNVERVKEKPREEVVREKRADEVEDGGPEVRVVVERLDVWRDGEEVKQLDDEMKGVLARLREIFAQEEVVQVPSLKSRQRVDVNMEVNLVNGLMHNVVVNTIDQVNKLLYAGSFVVAERLGLMRKSGKRQEKEEPWWKRRIERNIVRWRKDLARVEEVRSGKMELSRKERRRMDRAYGLTEKGTLSVREFLKSKIHSGSTKIRRFLEKGIQFHQNNLFKNNQSQLYKELGGAEADRNNPSPDAREATRFWGGIWSEPGRHEKDAEWLERVKRWTGGVVEQREVRVTTEDVVAGVRRMSNWKAPGPDGVRGFWFKKFSCMHQAMAKSLQACLDEGNVPEWMVKGRTVLIQKDPAKGTVASNYRPIACLPLGGSRKSSVVRCICCRGAVIN